MKEQLDINIVLEIYQSELAELKKENIFLKAYVKQMELKQAQPQLQDS